MKEKVSSFCVIPSHYYDPGGDTTVINGRLDLDVIVIAFKLFVRYT